jgi:hypothetical protein
MPNDPSLIRTDRKQMIRFAGFPDTQHRSHHLCVAHGIACGDNPIVPGALDLANSICDDSLTPARPCARVLIELGGEDTWTVWYVQLWSDGTIAWADMRWPDSIDLISVEQYRALLASWWSNRYHRR